MLDLEQSTILAKGQVLISEGIFTVDVLSEVHIVTDNIEVDESNHGSTRVRVESVEGAKMNVSIECPGEDVGEWDFEFVDDTFVMGWKGNAFGVSFDVRNTFVRVGGT